jgi:hypothetical protein
VPKWREETIDGKEKRRGEMGRRNGGVMNGMKTRKHASVARQRPTFHRTPPQKNRKEQKKRGKSRCPENGGGSGGRRVGPWEYCRRNEDTEKSTKHTGINDK